MVSMKTAVNEASSNPCWIAPTTAVWLLFAPDIAVRGAAESELRFRFPRTFLCLRLSNYGHPIGLLTHGSFIIANNKLLSALAVVETRSKGCVHSRHKTAITIIHAGNDT